MARVHGLQLLWGNNCSLPCKYPCVHACALACTLLTHMKATLFAAAFWICLKRAGLHSLRIMKKKKISNRNNCKQINTWIKIYPCKWIVSCKHLTEGLTKIKYSMDKMTRGPKVLKLQVWIKSRVMKMPQWYEDDNRELFFQGVQKDQEFHFLHCVWGNDLSSKSWQRDNGIL